MNLTYFNQRGRMLLMCISLGVVLFSCKEKDIIGESPYAKGPEPLVHFKDARPVPDEGKVGTEVTFAITGLKDGGDFTFYINQTPSEILNITDSSVTVKVPDNASSGAASVNISGQTYFGPIFTVEGKVSIAPSFEAFNGANNAIKQIVPKPDGSGSFLLVGNFTDYENKAAASDDIVIGHLVQISSSGEFIDLLTSGRGANGTINTITRNENTGDWFIGGSFGTFNIRGGINNVTRLNSDGSLDTMTVDLINLDPENTPNAGKDTVPAFNGGVTGGFFPGVNDLFYDEATDELTVIGNFTYYESVYYPRSTKGGSVIDITQMMQLVRLHADGSLDSSFNFNKTTDQSREGGNGYIADAIRTPDGKIIIVGSFTTFNGKTANRICRINNADGTLDETFNTGSGADGPVFRITYNDVTKKMLLTGAFDHFNGVPANGVVMLNADGSVDTEFKFGETTRGRANYAGQLDNGLIIVSGRFLKYEEVVRSGFMILNPDGTLAEGYNNTGAFVGQINQIMESETTLNDLGVILVGDFSRFNNRSVGNIVKIALKP